MSSYLLDDPLSAVDAHVGRHIFRQCVKGLLAHKCVVLVTHALEFLPACDQVIVLENGTIVDQGTFEKVSQATTGVLASLLQAQKEAQAQQAQEESPISPVDISPLSSEMKANSEEEKKESALGENEASKEINAETPAKETEIKKGELTVEETRVKGKVNRSVYSLYFKAAGGFGIIIVIFLLFILAQVVRAINNWWLTYWSNDSAGKDAKWYLEIYIVLGVLTVVVAIIAHLVLFFTGLKASSRLHDGLIKGILFSPMSFFDQTPIGRITNRISKDLYTVDKTIPLVFDQFLGCLFSVISTLDLSLAHLRQFRRNARWDFGDPSVPSAAAIHSEELRSSRSQPARLFHHLLLQLLARNPFRVRWNHHHRRDSASFCDPEELHGRTLHLDGRFSHQLLA